MRTMPGVCFSFLAILAVGAFGQDPKKPQHNDKDAPAEEPVATFEGHTSAVTALAFSPDGRRVVSSCSKDVRTWDAETGEEISVLKGLGGQVVAFGPDGKRLAIAAQFPRTGRDNVTLHDVADGKELLNIDPHGDLKGTSRFRPVVGSVAVSPDGERFATGGSTTNVGGPHGYPGGGVTVWDAKTGKPLHRFSLSTFASAVAFSRDGKYLAAGTDGAGGELPEPGEVWVWDIETGKAVHTFKTRDEVEPGENSRSAAAVALSPDGKRVAAAVSGVRPARPAGLIPQGEEEPADVLVWDLASGRVDLDLRGRDGWAGKIAFSPDGRWLASAGGGDRVIRVWSTATGKELKAFPSGTARVNAIAFSPDGRRLAVGGSAEGKSGVVKVWALDGDEGRRAPEKK